MLAGGYFEATRSFHCRGIPAIPNAECQGTHDHRHEWFEPLFSGMDINEQWEELGMRLGKLIPMPIKFIKQNNRFNNLIINQVQILKPM
jgi:hypothetical protein